MYKDVSIIVPLYNSGPRVSLLHQSLVNILSPCGNYEVIFIDDGSKDNTIQIIKGIKERDKRVRIVELGKHSGQYTAIFAGYKCSKGRIVISLDDDAFKELEYIPEFIRKIGDGYDAVFGWRTKDGYPFARKVASLFFNMVVSLIMGKRIHDLGSSLKAKNRKVVDKLISLGELTPFLRYYRYYRITEIKIPSRYSKRFPTRYNAVKLIKSMLLILKNNIFNKRKAPSIS